MTARALSTPMGGTRIGRSTPAARKVASCSWQRASGPVRHMASRIRSLREGPPTFFSIWSASIAKPLARKSRWKKGNALYRGALGQMSRGTFALEPAAHRGHVAPERDRRVSHVDAERGVDGWMADAETEHEAAIGGVGDERRALGARVGVAEVDVGDPRAHLEAPGRRAHELGSGHDVVVHLGGEDRVEACLLRLPRDGLDLTGAPAYAGDDCESEPIGHGGLLSSEADGRLRGLIPRMRPPARRDDCRASITERRRDPRPLSGGRGGEPSSAGSWGESRGCRVHQPFTRRTSAEKDRSAKTTRRNRAGSSLPKRATPAATPTRAGAAKTAVACQTSGVIKPAHQ